MHGFLNRSEAGKILAERLLQYAGRDDVVVLGLPRGGIPVGFEVARRLKAALDVFLVRKLGVPGQEELAMGAIATGGVRVFNEEVLSGMDISERVIEGITAREKAELERRETAYRGDRPTPRIEGRTVILVDDGVATGSTMLAAIAALRKRKPARLVVAVPTAARSSFETIARKADEAVAVLTPVAFFGVGQWYGDFSQTTDEEVRDLLEQARREYLENPRKKSA